MATSVQQSLRKAHILLKNGEFSKAAQIYKQILEKFPKNKNAILGYQKSMLKTKSKVTQTSDLIKVHLNELISLYNLGKFKIVLSEIDKIIGLFPNSHQLLNLQGVCNAALQKYDLAIISYKKALKIEKDYTDASNNYAGLYYTIGQELSRQNELDEALKNYKKAIEIRSNYAEALNDIGIILTKQGKLNEAVRYYNEAIISNPNYLAARMAKLYILAQICDWNNIQLDYQKILELNSNEGFGSPFTMLSLEDDPNKHLIRSQNYAANKFKQDAKIIPSRPIKKPARLRIGYFSSDFRVHPVAYLMAKVFEKHDRDKFEIYAYSLYFKEDTLRKRLEETFDVFKDVQGLSDKEVALIAQKDQIDIAVDLTGYTEHCRPGIFAYRAAPVQINYLGYPGTMGAKFMDYIIADQTLIPLDLQEYYTEKPIYLPNSYMATDNTRQVANSPVTRLEMGLPENGFVFCCFNNNYKISPVEFDIWMRLLKKVPDSVLWLRKSNEWSEINFQNEAKKRGINPDRLVFAGYAGMDEHLARHKLADLFLDTFAFNAHTTATEALWVGLPVVTKLGQGFAARVAGSLLTAIGLPELITETVQDYEELILDLASNPQRLKSIQLKLAKNISTQPLFDTELFVKHLEDGYQQAYQNYFDRKNPQAITVAR